MAIILVLTPHPSLLIVLVRYHLQVLHAPLVFVTHLLVTYALTLLIFSSLIVCVFRDPGQIPLGEGPTEEGEEIELAQALMSHDDDDEISAPGKWCAICQASKPERTRTHFSPFKGADLLELILCTHVL